MVTMAAAISCGVLLSGFFWWVVYPLDLQAVGHAGCCRAGLEATADSLFLTSEIFHVFFQVTALRNFGWFHHA
jgi:hypothetical protein